MYATACRARLVRRNRRGPVASLLAFAAFVAALALSVYGQGWVLTEAAVPAPEYAGARCVLDVAYDVAHDVGFADAPPSVACIASLEDTHHGQ
jgi:hypothetical protein